MTHNLTAVAQLNWAVWRHLIFLTLFSVGMSYAQCTIGGTYDLGPGDDGNQATGGPTGPFHLTATNSTFSYVGLIPNGSFTFAQLASLSATFTSNSGGSGGGTPRFSVVLDDGGTPTNLHVYLGNSPSYTDSDTVLNTYSGVNLIGNNDAGRYDTGNFSGGSPFTTYNSALALVGSLKVLEIFYVTDTFGSFPSRDETLFSINLVGPCPADALQFSYAVNLDKGDSVVNITNTGSLGSGSAGNICVNVYAFDPSEEIISCCACLVTPNALVSLSVQEDLLSNSLSPQTPTSVVIALAVTSAGGSSQISACDPGAASTATNVTSGMRAWSSTLHALPGSPATFGTTEIDFQSTTPSSVELTHLSSFCGFVEGNGSGFGICKSCRSGGLSGPKK